MPKSTDNHISFIRKILNINKSMMISMHLRTIGFNYAAPVIMETWRIRHYFDANGQLDWRDLMNPTAHRRRNSLEFFNLFIKTVSERLNLTARRILVDFIKRLSALLTQTLSVFDTLKSTTNRQRNGRHHRPQRRSDRADSAVPYADAFGRRQLLVLRPALHLTDRVVALFIAADLNILIFFVNTKYRVFQQ